jgi:hypothetical protein
MNMAAGIADVAGQRIAGRDIKGHAGAAVVAESDHDDAPSKELAKV